MDAAVQPALNHCCIDTYSHLGNTEPCTDLCFRQHQHPLVLQCPCLPLPPSSQGQIPGRLQRWYQELGCLAVECGPGWAQHLPVQRQTAAGWPLYPWQPLTAPLLLAVESGSSWAQRLPVRRQAAAGHPLHPWQAPTAPLLQSAAQPRLLAAVVQAAAGAGKVAMLAPSAPRQAALAGCARLVSNLAQ